MYPLILIAILIVARLIPHPPNFTPVIAVAIMSGLLFRNLYLSYGVLIAAMFLSDMLIGFYSNMFFVYLPLILISFYFFKITAKVNGRNLFIFGFLGSLIFFVLSNFGVWLTSDMYTKDINGLINCYILAIPFFKNTLASTIIFSYATFFANYYIQRKFI